MTALLLVLSFMSLDIPLVSTMSIADMIEKKYVVIHWDNIEQYKDGNFKRLGKDEATTLDLPYDVHSVMHYEEGAFANEEGLKTITVKGGQTVYNDELSPIDVMQARKLYNCSAGENVY